MLPVYGTHASMLVPGLTKAQMRSLELCFFIFSQISIWSLLVFSLALLRASCRVLKVSKELPTQGQKSPNIVSTEPHIEQKRPNLVKRAPIQSPIRDLQLIPDTLESPKRDLHCNPKETCNPI